MASPIERPKLMTAKKQRIAGLSLTELLCVMSIIAILLALSLGPITKAFIHAKKVIHQVGSN